MDSNTHSHITASGVKRQVNFILSLVFVIYGTACCIIFAAFLDTDIKSGVNAVSRVVSTVFAAIFALSVTTIAIIDFTRKQNSDRGFFWRQGSLSGRASPFFAARCLLILCRHCSFSRF